ncbi:hypothetical protein WR164_03500 [Philodulcilactobacillus myokoensis]|uniref:Uncharacterized protein n=1 Tax=Philodulcilactobacillus myokoensis TaxID=2929573 RepID=A0A9W6ERF2_9LACO|nr:hypothetical protein [Philodulcilactobacillus myokoensis]GLB46371.1 hypothetical protein WR164_03500 [Philodulcilactobacillus myokoensis]
MDTSVSDLGDHVVGFAIVSIIFMFLLVLTVMIFRAHHKWYGLLMVIGLCISGGFMGLFADTYISLYQQQSDAQYQLNHDSNWTKMKLAEDRYTIKYFADHHFHVQLADYEVDKEGNETDYPVMINHNHWSSISIVYQNGHNHIKSISIGKRNH